MMIQKSTLSACLFLFLTIFSVSAADQSLMQHHRSNTDQDTPFNHELVCLTKNIYYESRGEPFEGKLAVATVTINRVAHPKYPKTVCEVVYQKVGGTWQFSWVPNKSGKVKNQKEWKDSRAAARIVLTHNQPYDKVSNAIYFHAVTVDPKWKYQKVAQVGNHIFYR